MASNIITFPRNLDSGSGRPFILFTASDKSGDTTSIFLPIPAGITFADGGAYSTIDLGILGSLPGTDSIGPNSGAKAMTSLGGMLKQSKDIKGGEIAAIVATAAAGAMGGNSTIAKAAFLASPNRKIINPNTNTTFTGNNLRTFDFTFTMVGRSEEDSRSVRDIHNSFRKYIYPKNTLDDSNVIIDYPPIWNIRFMNRGGTNQWLPRIYECYLKDLTTNFNPSATMFRKDFSPVETQITISFQETRTLLRDDIEELNAHRGAFGIL